MAAGRGARGTYVRVGHDHYGAGMHRVLGSMPSVLALVVRAPFTPELHLPGRSTPRLQRLEHLARLLEEGAVRPVVDRTFPLHDAAGAMAYLASGRAAGRVVLTVPSTGSRDHPSPGAGRG
ncbi:zinc-binding dehydrogenase [Aquipuribacter hungaricus]|uniref:Zinc-binding dehydrogenase n=1 Tax=Aquipuribacter hungaricus TaxID=545624 RepID=A0ABV7WJ07_9MICO